MGQVLHGENTSPRVAAKFYKAVVQAVLLYGSETWNLTKAALAWLEGFHIRAAYKMARVHRPKKGAHGLWQYPKSADVVHTSTPTDDCCVRGGSPDFGGLPTRQSATRINAQTVVVGAADGAGRDR